MSITMGIYKQYCRVNGLKDCELKSLEKFFKFMESSAFERKYSVLYKKVN